MLTLDSCYELLGLKRGASQEEIRGAFHRLARQLYSSWEGPQAAARLQAIAEAYSRLEVASPGKDSTVSPSPAPRWLWRLSGHIRSALSCGGVQVLPDGTVELRLDEDEARTGGTATLSFETDIVCRRCGPTPEAGCARCDGTGRERELVSFWLALPAHIAHGTVLHPSVEPLKLVKPVGFVVRISAPA